MKKSVMKWGLSALVVSVLAACGGGTSSTKFEPLRVLSFGDELSVIDDTAAPGNGRKYAVNGFTTNTSTTPPTTAEDCTVYPIWNQSLAAAFGIAFPQCKGSSTQQAGRILAQAGAHVAGLKGQIDSYLAGDTLSGKDLVTVMVGMHDIIDLQGQATGQNDAELLAKAEALGAELGVQVNRLADAGGKVIISTVPDLSVSPWALALDKAAGNKLATERVRNLTARFNAKLRITIYNDGRRLGLILSDETMQAMVKFPAGFGKTNVVDAACQSSVVLPNCTTTDLIQTVDAAGNPVVDATGKPILASPTAYMWADSLRFSPGVHSRIGDLAVGRANNNPFGGG